MGSIILHHADLPPSRMTRTDQAGHAIPDTDPLAADWLPVTVWRSREDMASSPPGSDWQVQQCFSGLHPWKQRPQYTDICGSWALLVEEWM